MVVAVSRFEIMLVDDHEVVRSGYRRFIEADPSLHVCAEAASAQEAYGWLQAAEAAQGLPDLVVVDLSLGDRSGIDLIDRCRRRFAGLRTLVFSMHEDPALVEHALDAGAMGYVSKASPPATVLTAITRIRSGARFVDPALAPRPPSSDARAAALEQLTRRELEILGHLMRGADPEEVARVLTLSTKTVANHLSAIRGKLKVGNDFQLMRLVTRLGLPLL
jgi:DNA-binding NarL/FixJ family response regulator